MRPGTPRCWWPELCPTVWHIPGGFLTVMRRARPLADGGWTGLPEHFGQGPDRVVPVERKRDRFGVLHGRVVAVDCGS